MRAHTTLAVAAATLAMVLGTKAPQAIAQDKPAAAQEKPAAVPDKPNAGAADKAAPPAVKVTAEQDGFVLQSPNGDYRLQLNAILQADGRFFWSDTDRLATDSFLLRSARPILQGTVASRFDLYLAPDFGQGQSLIQDAYLDARFSPKVRLRVGKFKPPYGLERLQSEANILFVERALPTGLVPNRDVGLQLSGELGAGVFSWAAAVTNGVVDGASGDLATNDARDLAGRVFVRPFRRAGGPLKGLGLGLAATSGRQQGTLLPVYRTPGQVAFFSYVAGAVADGHRSRLSPQASFYGGPVGVLAEYALTRQVVRKDSVSATTANDAWQLAASCLLTGESATGGGIRPRRPFDPSKGQWGAFELAARVHQLRVDDVAYDLGLADIRKAARQATAWGVGLNWYLNRNVKYVLNYEQTRFEGGAASGDRETESVLFLRAQIAF